MSHVSHSNCGRPGYRFRRQAAVPVVYRGFHLDTGFRADLLIADDLIIEIKAVDRLVPAHEAQLLTYSAHEWLPGGPAPQLQCGPARDTRPNTDLVAMHLSSRPLDIAPPGDARQGDGHALSRKRPSTCG